MILWIHSLSEYSDKDPSQINMILLALYNLGLKEFFGHKLHFFSCFSCVRHFATLWTVGHQAPLSMGYSRQEYWESFHTFLQGIFLAQGSNPLLFYLLHWQAGSLPLVPPGKTWGCESHSVMPNSLQSRGLYSPWNSPGQNTGVGSVSLLQGIFPTQGSDLSLLHCRQILYQLSYQEALTLKGKVKK